MYFFHLSKPLVSSANLLLVAASSQFTEASPWFDSNNNLF
jgi:hypothetical protein